MANESKAKLTTSEKEKLLSIYEENVNSLWRQRFHIQPILGNMKAISCFYADEKNQYIYYTNDTIQEKRDNWYGVNVIDNAFMENGGIVLEPNLLWDNVGIGSGTSFVEDNETYFIYIGNHVGLQNEEKKYVLLAKKDDDERILKGKKPLFEIHDLEISSNPKLIHRDKYYILIGGKDKNRGKLFLYASDELFKGYSYQGEFKVKGYDELGKNVKSFDIITINGFDVLVMTVENDSESYGESTIYFIGKCNFENKEFSTQHEMQELDFGFDFSDARFMQSANSTYFIGKLGDEKPSYEVLQQYPTLDSLSCIRKCILKNGKLYCTPAFAKEVLQDELLLEAKEGNLLKDTLQGRMPKCAILHLENPELESVEFDLFSNQKKLGFMVKYEKYTKKFIINDADLENTALHRNHEKSIHLENGLKDLEIFVDNSSIEIFVNHGEFTFSSRLFATANEHLLRMSAKNVNLTIHSIKRATNDQFRI